LLLFAFPKRAEKKNFADSFSHSIVRREIISKSFSLRPEHDAAMMNANLRQKAHYGAESNVIANEIQHWKLRSDREIIVVNNNEEANMSGSGVDCVRVAAFHAASST
jgi:hypothetical protein